MFRKQYADVFAGDREWRRIKTAKSMTYSWDGSSTYVQQPPYFIGMPAEPTKIGDIAGARLLAILGDSITTDHIPPARSEERRAGKECVRKCKSRWSPNH